MITIILHLIGFFQLQKVKIKGPKIIKIAQKFCEWKPYKYPKPSIHLGVIKILKTFKIKRYCCIP